jgi:hypothetical protein
MRIWFFHPARCARVPDTIDVRAPLARFLWGGSPDPRTLQRTLQRRTPRSGSSAPLLHPQLNPPRQRRGLILQKNYPPRLRKR